MKIEKTEIPQDKEYILRPQTPKEKEASQSDEYPRYKLELDLSEEEVKNLTEQVFLEFEALKDERSVLGLEQKWEDADRQYDGEVKENNTLAFNLHVHQSKIKVDAIVRALSEAFLDSNPMFDCTPRPETARNDGYAIAEKQAQFLDYAVDEEICPETAIVKIASCATKKFVGIGKLSWAYKSENRRREETYEGKLIPIAETASGQVIFKNEGVERFVQAYPDEALNKKGFIQRLIDQKKIVVVVEYKDTIDNNPKLEYIKLENFYVKNSCDYWLGLRDTHIVVERQSYTYWELKKKEEAGEFKDVSRLWTAADSKEEINEKDYKTEDYDVLEVTTYFKLDGKEVKIKAWFSEEKEIYLGGILYPYYGFDIDYIPFYLKFNDYGFYGDCKSVMSDLKDSNIAQNVLLNLTLHGGYIRNMLTPIVKSGSEVESLFLDNEFAPGKPIPVDELTDDVNNAFGFVQWPNVDINGMMFLMEKLKRIDSDVTRVSDLTTGAESQLDPSAPASKTMALLQQSGIGIKDYIRNFLPSFNILASMILQLYYQMSQEDKKFKVVGKAFAVTGQNPFSLIKREEMVVKTNIQARAASFVFDKINEKKEALAAYQVVMGDSYARQQPKLLYKALKTVLETFGDRWKTIVDTDLVSPEEFQAQLNQVALMAIQQLGAQAMQQAKLTGVAPNTQELLASAPSAVQQAQTEFYSPELAPQEGKQ